MIYPIKKLTILSQLRGLSGSVYGLSIHTDKQIKKFAKYMGIPKNKHCKVPHIKTLSDGRPSSKRVRFFPKYSFAEPHMIKVVRIKYVLDKFYIFGSRLLDIVGIRSLKNNSVQNYRYLRKIVGLPCNGQRSKTNAQTTKKRCRSLLKQYPQRTRLYFKILRLMCMHQSKDIIKYAQKLKEEREEMIKLRVIRELQGTRRYRHKSSQDPEEHYETIYSQIKNRKRL